MRMVFRVQAPHKDICPDTAALWVASRKLDNSKTLAAEVGRNDKTRVTMTLQRTKEPAPPRSAVRSSPLSRSCAVTARRMP